MVLIHGLGGSSDWWRYNVEALSKSHTVAAVDLVGFGRNRLFLRRTKLPLQFEEIAALLARWIESSFSEPVHLVGNSMGGHVAIHLAARNPERVRSLTLVNATGIPFALKPGQHLENLMLPRGWYSFAKILARDLFRSGPTALFLAFSRLIRDDARPLLRTLTMPVLLLWGESDPLVPLSYAEQVRAEVPQARLVVIPNAGHIPMWESPERFNRELLAFLSDVDRQQAVTASESRFAWGISGWTGGIAHREAGTRRDAVLIHGLGMSSLYLGPLARELFARGWHPIAPDLPGFGESANAPACGPAEHAAKLAAWARENRINDATWVGHSTGCDAVCHLAAEHPELAREAIFVGPLWSRKRHPWRRLAFDLCLDAFREPLALYPFVIRAYWRTGLRRWIATWRRYASDTRYDPRLPPRFAMLGGRRDPLIDRERILELAPNANLDLPGAHACVFESPRETAEAIAANRVTIERP